MQKSFIKDIIQFPFAIFAKICEHKHAYREYDLVNRRNIFLYENSWYLILCLKVPPHSSSRPSTFFIYKQSVEEIFFIETFNLYFFRPPVHRLYIYMYYLYSILQCDLPPLRPHSGEATGRDSNPKRKVCRGRTLTTRPPETYPPDTLYKYWHKFLQREGGGAVTVGPPNPTPVSSHLLNVMNRYCLKSLLLLYFFRKKGERRFRRDFKKISKI